ncbi:MAG: hypothetical protein V1831_01545 [Candidatus Woesearchaeota archaeon]
MTYTPNTPTKGGNSSNPAALQPYDNMLVLAKTLKGQRNDLVRFKKNSIRFLEQIGSASRLNSVYRLAYGAANTFSFFIPSKIDVLDIKGWTERNRERYNNPLAYIENGYRGNLNGIQDSLISLDREAQDLGLKIESNLNLLEQMRNEDWSLEQVWNTIVGIASQHGLQTLVSTQDYISRSRQDMTEEEIGNQREYMIGTFQDTLNRQSQLIKVINQSGKAATITYQLGLAEFVSFMQTAPAVSTVYRVAELLTDTSAVMYAGAKIPTDMLGKAVDAITLVLESMYQLPSVSSPEALETIVQKSKQLQTSISKARSAKQLSSSTSQ